MDVLQWVITLLQNLLSKTSLPGWLVTFIIGVVEKYLTADVLKQLEDEVVCFVCAKVQLLAGSDPTAQQVAAGLESVLGCSKCLQAQQPAAPAAQP